MINNICKKLYNKTFKLEKCFNHSSFANKNKIESNERLEFLGDSIVNYFTTNWLFKTQLGDEGKLSKLRAKMVSTEAFAKICDTISLCDNLKIEGEISSKIKANLLEAVIAEIYLQLDNKNDIDKLIHFLIIDNFDSSDFEDSKTLLQELLQKNKHYNIVYKTEKIKEKFVASVLNNGLVLAEGEGESKQLAQKDAAKKALIKLKKEVK